MYWASHIGRERASLPCWPRSGQDGQIWRIIDLAPVPISKTRMEFQIRLGKPVLLKIGGSGWSNTGSLKDNSSPRGIGMIVVLFGALGNNPACLQYRACTRDCSYSVTGSPSTFSKGQTAIFSNFVDVPQLLTCL